MPETVQSCSTGLVASGRHARPAAQPATPVRHNARKTASSSATALAIPRAFEADTGSMPVAIAAAIASIQAGLV
jgi:hypothetical protein